MIEKVDTEFAERVIRCSMSQRSYIMSSRASVDRLSVGRPRHGSAPRALVDRLLLEWRAARRLAHRCRCVALALVIVGCAASPGGSSVASVPTAEPLSASDSVDSDLSNGQGIIVGYRAISPGDVWIEERRAQVQLKMHRGGPPWPEALEQRIDQRERVRITIVGVSEGVVTKKRVELLEQQRERRIGERVDRAPSPVLGKVYDIEYTSDQIRVSRVDNTPISAPEESTILVEYAGSGRRGGLGAILPKRPLRIGETLALSSEEAMAMFGQSGKHMQAQGMRLTLTSTDAQRATFAVAVRMTLTESGMTTTRDLHGTVTIERGTGWPTSVHVEGTIELTGQTHAPGTVEGEGTMSLDVSTHYAP